MTVGQINKAVANYRALLEKHAGEFSPEAVQTALGQQELAKEELEVFRRRVEANSNLIVCKVRVDRSRTPQEVLDATGRVQHTNQSIVDTMPKGEGDEVEVMFFKLGRFVKTEELAREYELRGLIPDPYAQAQVNEDDPAFADQHFNSCFWDHDGENVSFVSFFRHGGGQREVRIGRGNHGWGGGWWFAGSRK
jgi:hypothetical protein